MATNTLRSHDGLGALLVECLRDGAAPSERLQAALGQADLRHLVAAAEHHGIGPAVYSQLVHLSGIPDQVIAGLVEAYQRQWQTQLRMIADLPDVVRLLRRLDVPWAVVKGPVLSEAVYATAHVRSYVDLDLVVHRSGLPAVLEALESAGARLVDRNWTMMLAELRGEISMVLRHGTALDLHWHVFNEPRQRRAFSVSMEHLFAGTRTVSINGVETKTFNAVDTLVFLAMHAGLAGGYRLVWFKDLEQSILNDRPDWDEVIRRCRAWRVSLLVATMLARCERVLAPGIPPEAIDALAPKSGWRTALAIADRFSPPQSSYGRQLTARTLVAATRASTPTSLVELGRSAWIDLLKPVLTNPAHPWRRRKGAQPPQSPRQNPLFQSSGADTDRRTFLHLVSQAVVDP